MTETEIREILRKIKMMHNKFISVYFGAGDCYDGDNMTAYIKHTNETYIINMKELIGSVNKIRSERILKALGFEREKETYLSSGTNGHYVKSNKWLIPANMLPLIDEGTELESILGDKKIVGKDEIDTDNRNGMLAYYITIEGVGR